jgi:hypothetical protein
MRARQAAAETQRSVNVEADQAIAEAKTRADNEHLAADREAERVLTSARRNRV